MMRNGWPILVVVVVVFSLADAVGAGEGEGYAFATDKAGQLLARLLRPGEKPAADATPQTPRALARLENLEMPLPLLVVEAPRPKPELGGRAVPRPVAEGTPLAGQVSDPVRPGGVKLPAGVRVRLPSVDVTQPIPLPILGVAQPDRAPLTDPTTAASLAAALASPMPIRSVPAPFLRLSVPDPFEHSHVVRMRTLLPESPAGPSAEPSRPGR